MKKINYLNNDLYVLRLRDKFIITTDHGKWICLDSKEFNSLENKNLESELFNKLEEKGIIITENNCTLITEDFRNKKKFLFQGPSLHIIILTLRCNMKCVYCHASSKCAGDDGYDMSLETARKTVDFIFQTPSKGVTIEFQGGEPLMNFEVLKYIVDYAKEVNNSFKKDLRFSIVTNLTLMDDEKLDFLLKTGVSICTSLDGPVTINKKNRIFLGDEKIEYWIRKINEKSKINALPTITKNNIGYWKEVIDEYVRLGLNNIHLRFLNNLGYAKDMWSKISYSAEDFVDMWVKSMDYIFELNKKGIDMKERMALIISSKLLMNKEPNYSELRSPCGAIIGQIAYNYDGFIYTCDEARMLGEEIFRVGSVNQDMKSVVHSDKSCNIIASACNDFFCYSCVFSPYCGICPVCNYVEQGSVVGKIPQTDRCKVYKAQFTYLFNKILFDKDALEILNKWLTTN